MAQLVLACFQFKHYLFLNIHGGDVRLVGWQVGRGGTVGTVGTKTWTWLRGEGHVTLKITIATLGGVRKPPGPITMLTNANMGGACKPPGPITILTSDI